MLLCRRKRKQQKDLNIEDDSSLPKSFFGIVTVLPVAMELPGGHEPSWVGTDAAVELSTLPQINGGWTASNTSASWLSSRGTNTSPGLHTVTRGSTVLATGTTGEHIVAMDFILQQLKLIVNGDGLVCGRYQLSSFEEPLCGGTGTSLADMRRTSIIFN